LVALAAKANRTSFARRATNEPPCSPIAPPPPAPSTNDGPTALSADEAARVTAVATQCEWLHWCRSGRISVAFRRSVSRLSFFLAPFARLFQRFFRLYCSLRRLGDVAMFNLLQRVGSLPLPKCPASADANVSSAPSAATVAPALARNGSPIAFAATVAPALAYSLSRFHVPTHHLAVPVVSARGGVVDG
jgi:hypothetical protein